MECRMAHFASLPGRSRQSNAALLFVFPGASSVELLDGGVAGYSGHRTSSFTSLMQARRPAWNSNSDVLTCPGISKPLLEPVMGVGLCVERSYLIVALCPVEGLSLGERTVGLQAQFRQASLMSLRLQQSQNAACDPQPPHVRCCPHPLDLA